MKDSIFSIIDFYQTSNKVKFTICYRELQFFNQPYPEDLINSIKDQISFVLQMTPKYPKSNSVWCEPLRVADNFRQMKWGY